MVGAFSPHATLAAGRDGRVLDVQGSRARRIDVRLLRLRLTRGQVSGRGGVLRSAYADVTLRNSLVSRGSAGRGGGISSRGRLTLWDTHVSNNTADSGGGIIARGRLILAGRVRHNRAGITGGGILAVNDPRPRVLVGVNAAVRNNDPEDIRIKVREVVAPQARAR